MSTEVAVTVLPYCDLCRANGRSLGVETLVPAYADAKLDIGPWAYVCEPHFRQHGCRLGTGRGQRLVLEGEQ